jgi:hypothetical protein
MVEYAGHYAVWHLWYRKWEFNAEYSWGGGEGGWRAAARRSTKAVAVTNRACGALEVRYVRDRLEASPRRRVHILLHPYGFRHLPQTRKRADARHEKFVKTQQLSELGWVFEEGGLSAKYFVENVEEGWFVDGNEEYWVKISTIFGAWPCGRGKMRIHCGIILGGETTGTTGENNIWGSTG